MGDMEPVGETGLSQVRKSVTNLFVQRQSCVGRVNIENQIVVFVNSQEVRRLVQDNKLVKMCITSGCFLIVPFCFDYNTKLITK